MMLDLSYLEVMFPLCCPTDRTESGELITLSIRFRNVSLNFMECKKFFYNSVDIHIHCRK